MKFFLTAKLKSCSTFLLVSCWLFFLSFGAIALADEASPVSTTSGTGPFMGLKVGTLGLGADMGYAFSDFFKTRLNVNYFTLDKDWDDDDEGDEPLSTNASIDCLTAGLLLDLHPFRNGFRLTGGIYHNGLEFKMDEDFGAWKAHSSVEFNKVAPYAGIGYGNTNENGLSFNFDIGAMFLGSPKAHYSNPAKSQAEIEEEIKDLEDDLEGLPCYPVVMLGITYRF